MFHLAERAKTEVSPIRQIFRQLPAIEARRKAEGLSPLIDLSIGQPHIAANPEVMQKLQEMEVTQAALGYAPAQGEPATLAAIVKLYKYYYPMVQYATTEAMTTGGASGALSNIFSILVQEKDDVILTFEPYFGAYTGQVQQWGGTLQKIPTLHNNFRPTAEGLEQALQTYPNTKALIINYPNNPSGVALTKAEVEQLAKSLEKYPEVLIIIDDVYRDFNYAEHYTILDVAPHLKDRCIVINSGAKGLLGAPGERIGMLAAHKDLINSMVALQTNNISGIPCRTQAALRFAVESHLNNPKNAWLMHAKAEYKNNVSIAYHAFKTQGFMISQKPGGAFYLLISAKHLIGKKIPNTLEEIKNDVDIANYFLHAAGVATVPGSGFGIEPTAGYLRISCAKRNHFLIEAAYRMGDAARLVLKFALENKLEKPNKLTSNDNVRLFALLWKSRNQNLTDAEQNDLLAYKNVVN
jgi:aspartate aminotransferase